MAISREGITRGRSEANSVGSLSKDLKTSGENLKNILQSNGNYQYFKMGTDKGTSVDQDLNKTIDTVVNALVPQINSLLAAIEALFEKQEENNRRREMQQRLQSSNAGAISGAAVFINGIKE